MTVAHEPVVLRDYQAASVRSVCQAAKRGERRISVALPTGGGKTEVFAELCRIARYPLVLAPLVELMRQASDRLQLRLGEPVEIEQGENYAEPIEALRCRVMVGSRDSMLSRERYKRVAYERVSLVVVDEIHIGTTPALEKMLQWFEARGATIVGFSATPYRKKGKALRYWPRPQVSHGLLDFIREGWLVGPTCHMSESSAFDLTLIDEVSGEWDKSQLASVLAAEHFGQEVSSLVLQTYKQKPAVVYAGNVRQAQLLADVFDRYGAKVSVVHSRQSTEKRKANMDAFLCGDTKIIVNVGILSCGWDHPEVRSIYFGSPQRSLSRYEQRLGRGTRTLPGVLIPGMTRDERLAAIAASDKPTFNVWDITDSSRSHQLLNALAVLDHKCRKSAARQTAMSSALGADGVNAVDAIAAQDAVDFAEMEAKTAELIEKRKRLIVGVSFDHETRDLFAEPETKKKRGWRMLYGKYQGTALTDIPASYLSWVLNSTKKETPFISAVRRELVARKTK